MMGAVLLAAALLGSAFAQPAEAVKKKAKGAGSLRATKQVNAAIPDRGAELADPFGQLSSTIVAGKKFKGRRIRDVNLTLQTTGTTPGSPARDLHVVVTAPNGASSLLLSTLFGAGPIGTTPISIGPLTLDDEAGLALGSGGARDPASLYEPWVGSARPRFSALYPLDGGPVRGTWTLRVLDSEFGETSVLNFWRLDVAAGKPYRTK